jgi:hypothetical protein
MIRQADNVSIVLTSRDDPSIEFARNIAFFLTRFIIQDYQVQGHVRIDGQFNSNCRPGCRIRVSGDVSKEIKSRMEIALRDRLGNLSIAFGLPLLDDLSPLTVDVVDAREKTSRKDPTNGK